MKEKVLYRWETNEFDYNRKDPAWYVNVTIILLGVAALFIWVIEIKLGAIIALLGLISLYVHGDVEPKKISCSISNKKVKIGRRKIEFKNLRSFWVAKSRQPKLYLQTTAFLFSVITVPIGKGDWDKISRNLKKYLPEESRGELISDRIARLFHF